MFSWYASFRRHFSEDYRGRERPVADELPWHVYLCRVNIYFTERRGARYNIHHTTYNIRRTQYSIQHTRNLYTKR